MEWRTVHAKDVRQPTQRMMPTWKKPEIGWVKANADGAMTKSKMVGAGGVVLRDCHGEFLAGACHFFPAVVDREVAQLQACCRAIVLAQELNVQKLILETDSKEAVRKLVEVNKDFSRTGHLVQEIKALLRGVQEHRVIYGFVGVRIK